MTFKPSHSSHLPTNAIVGRPSTAEYKANWDEALGVTRETKCRCGHVRQEHQSDSPGGLDLCRAAGCTCLVFRRMV